MGLPRVSIIWLNYNSMGFIDIVEKSLVSLRDLDYPDYEVIVVDNGSIDGSFEVIRGLVERWRSARARLVRLDRNTGFTGGNNIGFRARDRGSRYVVLVNNDTIVYPDSLRELIEYIESDSERVGAAQPLIMAPGGVVGSYGWLMDETLMVYPLLHGSREAYIKRPIVATYAEGAYAVYRVEAVLDIWRGEERLFFDWGFGYFDDNIIGLQMWNRGWVVRAYPVAGGLHMVSKTFGRRDTLLKIYLVLRNTLVLASVSNSRYRDLIPLLLLRDLVPRVARAVGAGERPDKISGVVARAFRDARRISRGLAERGFRIDLYRAPLIRIGLGEVTRMLLHYRRPVVERISRRVAETLARDRGPLGVSS